MSAELVLKPNILITSKTDLHGNILYCNNHFLEYAGYGEEEVLFKSHNIVRHKDMPKSVFKILWSHIKQGKEVFAFVKNRTKCDNFYWVFANVTPSYDTQNRIVGYYSVRRQANPKAIDIISAFYKELLQLEANKGIEQTQDILLQKILKTHDSYNHCMLELQQKGVLC